MHSTQYEKIYNDGERLIPGESHDLAEVIRHKSSYRFFREIIESDLKRVEGETARILDLGCGVGHGSYLLSGLQGVEIIGIDPSPESIEYARTNYAAQNITFVNADAESFLARGETFDYIVSRHALEHAENGLELARRYCCSRRLMINVPYREPEGNPHHKVHFITENSFVGYDGAEFFFEDMQGVTETAADKLDFANSIVCILTYDESSKVADMLKFPYSAWSPSLQERILIETSASVKQLQTQFVDLNETIQRLEQEKAEVSVSLEALRSQLSSEWKAQREGLAEQVNLLKQSQAEVDAIRGTLLFRVLRKIAMMLQR